MLGFSPLTSSPLADSGVTSVDYIFVADQGSLSASGQAANLNVNRKLSAGNGSFTLTGQAAIPTRL